MPIPKIIHQTIRFKAGLHPVFQENIEYLKRVNPGWEHRLYDDEDCRRFILQVYGQGYLDTFNRIDSAYGAAKADFFRYLLMYECGGVYLDIKSRTRQPLSQALADDDRYILSYWDNAPGGKFAGCGLWPEYGVPSELQQWHIIASPKHPYLQAVIEQVKFNLDHYDPFQLDIGGLSVLRGTGPIAYSLAIEPIKNVHPHRLVCIEDLGIEYSFLEERKMNHRDLLGSNYAKSNRFLTPIPTTKALRYRVYRWLSQDLKVLIRHPIPRPVKQKFKQWMRLP